MKALFLSVTAGHGHNSAAKSVIAYLESLGLNCAMLDTFEYINPVLSKSISKVNSISTKFTPSLYGRLYRLAEKKDKNNTKFSISKLINSILSQKLVTYIKNYQPDIIVCTHVFAAQIITALNEKKLDIPSIGIITDFTIHPFWEDTNLDWYITACELLDNQIAKKNIPLSKVRSTGIPIHSKFSKKVNYFKARTLLGLKDRSTILLMGGGTGHGNILGLIHKLDELDLDFQIISVCGSNQKLKEKIDKFNSEKIIYNYGYVDNIDMLMDASNFIITKPGGLTISESLAKEIPIILIDPIPGQENRNAEFLQNNGAAVKISPTFTIDEAVFQLLSNTHREKIYRHSIKNIKKPNSSKELGEFIIETIKKRNNEPDNFFILAEPKPYAKSFFSNLISGIFLAFGKLSLFNS